MVRFEFERAGYTLPESARFMNRGLDFCMDIFDFDAMPEEVVRSEFMFTPQLEETYHDTAYRYHLIGSETTPRFQVKKTVLTGSVARQENTFFTGVVTDGSCVIKTESCEIALDPMSKFFCPAGLGPYSIEANEEVHILECFPPEKLGD